MNDFSELLNNLLLNTSKKKKIELLCSYFQNSKLEDNAWALSILTNSFDKKFLSIKDLKDIIIKKVGDILFKYSYDYVGDLAETISLLWQEKKKIKVDLKLNEFMESLLKINDRERLKKKIQLILDESDKDQRYCILKILTGGLRVGVSHGIVRESLAKYGCRTSHDIDEYWHGFKKPFIEFFEWLNGKDLPKYINRRELFNSFMLANNFKYEEFSDNDTKRFTAEFKWDGIRAQIIFSKNGKIYSRNGENITLSFPDIDTNDKDYYVIDGELVIKKDEQILSFNNLQKRIGRKKVSTRLVSELPIHFIAYDILFFKDIDCRTLPFKNRRKYLSSFIKYKSFKNFSLSKFIDFTSWNDLRIIKENALNNHIEGVVIKNKDSLYKKGRVLDGWYKWKRKPFSFDFIIMYAQRGHGKRSSFYSDFTFGCWVDNQFDKLVPVGKAYSGYTNEELKKLDLWIRNNTIERFGPVRSVKPGLVVEVSFDNLNVSTRHKSGVALRFPRFSRIRWDKPISDICILEDLKNLIN